MRATIPPIFDEAFLQWFRTRTEAFWRKVPACSEEAFFAQPEEEQGWHPGWRGARWLEPLADEVIAAIEEQWQLCFPPDYRLFFKWLHATDRSRTVVSIDDRFSWQDTGLFHNWQEAPGSIHWAYEHILGGFVFDALQNADRFWRSSWGPRPVSEEEARERLKPIVAAAPRLIPIHGCRYLLAEPCQAGNPVFSIWQSDIVVIAPDLRTYLLKEFSRSTAFKLNYGSSLLYLTTHDQKGVNQEISCLMEERRASYKMIPFWGHYL